MCNKEQFEALHPVLKCVAHMCQISLLTVAHQVTSELDMHHNTAADFCL